MLHMLPETERDRETAPFTRFENVFAVSGERQRERERTPPDLDATHATRDRERTPPDLDATHATRDRERQRPHLSRDLKKFFFAVSGTQRETEREMNDVSNAFKNVPKEKIRLLEARLTAPSPNSRVCCLCVFISFIFVSRRATKRLFFSPQTGNDTRSSDLPDTSIIDQQSVG